MIACISLYHFGFAKFRTNCVEAETHAVRPDQSQRRYMFSANEGKKLKVLFLRTPPVEPLVPGSELHKIRR